MFKSPARRSNAHLQFQHSEKLRQLDYDFRASLGYIVMPQLKKQNKECYFPLHPKKTPSNRDQDSHTL